MRGHHLRKIALLIGCYALLQGCMIWKNVDGAAVPKNSRTGFALRSQDTGHPISGVYLMEDRNRDRYCAIIFWKSGVCLETFSYPNPPSLDVLESAKGVVGRYKIQDQDLIIEGLAFDSDGRRYQVEEGTYSPKKITLLHRRWRNKMEWDSFCEVFHEYTFEGTLPEPAWAGACVSMKSEKTVDLKNTRVEQNGQFLQSASIGLLCVSMPLLFPILLPYEIYKSVKTEGTTSQPYFKIEQNVSLKSKP